VAEGEEDLSCAGRKRTWGKKWENLITLGGRGKYERKLRRSGEGGGASRRLLHQPDKFESGTLGRRDAEPRTGISVA